MPWTKITRVEYQRNGLRYASDLTDAEWALIAGKNASKTATWAATGSRSTRGRTGDFLHSVHRLPVASITERVPAILNCPELFLRLAGHRQVAQNRQSPGTASKTKARTQAHADCGYHRQPKCFNDAGRRPSRL